MVSLRVSFKFSAGGQTGFHRQANLFLLSWISLQETRSKMVKPGDQNHSHSQLICSVPGPWWSHCSVIVFLDGEFLHISADCKTVNALGDTRAPEMSLGRVWTFARVSISADKQFNPGVFSWRQWRMSRDRLRLRPHNTGEISKRSFISMVTPTVHSNPSWQRKLKTL